MSTTTEIQAGPALDAEVARLVFGVKRFYDWDGRLWKPEYEPYSPIHFIPSGKPWRTHRIDAIPVPRYSTDWGAAGQVVESWRTDRDGSTGLFEIYHGSDDYRVTIWTGGRTIEAYGPTMPLAVCRAALAAVERAGEGQ